MKKITYIGVLCTLVFACTSPDDSLPPADGGNKTDPQWFDGLDLPQADPTGYPYDRTKMTTATVSINTSSKVAANNLLLGLNFSGFTTADEKEIVRYLDPVTVRFPTGVWSNWYDWETDSYSYPNDGYDIGEFHRRVIDTWQILGVVGGFPGLKELHDELGFNMLFTYNVNTDSPAESVARLKDREAKGFDVKYIELGNEQFWEDQRSAKTATPINYLMTASAIAKALKAEKPSVKLSVPYGWRANQAAYNAQVGLKIGPFEIDFDAISLHKYVDPEKSSPNVVKTKDTYKTILNSGREIDIAKDFVSQFKPDKTIWLTEWGVNAGKSAASYLGQADAYLYLFANQDVYERAEWFGATTVLNAMYKYEGDPVPGSPLVNLKKTGFGMVYEILRDVFEDSELLETTVFTRILDESMNAVEARAVTKNGKTQLFVLNKTPRSVPFRAEIDGKFWEGSQKLESLSFNSLQDDKLLDANENPLTLISEGTDVVVLPPFSVSKITL
tara:strand:- start:68 stop:1570 length:1503 start_codon:yes stop_codon:yes gene_type:complete